MLINDCTGQLHASTVAGHAVADALCSSTNSSALAVGDLNGDNADDIFCGVAGGGEPKFYGVYSTAPNVMLLNDGNGAFVLVPDHPAVTPHCRATAVQIADLNNDHIHDLFITNSDCFNQLFINGGAGELVAITTGDAVRTRSSNSVVADDFNADNGDSWLDLFVTGSASHVLINNGSGHFVILSVTVR